MSAETICRAAEEAGIEILRTTGTHSCEVAPGEERTLLVVHEHRDATALRIVLHRGARLRLTELFLDEAFRTLNIEQEEASASDITLLQLGSSNMECRIDLNAPQAESRLNALFLAAAGEHCEIALRTNHNSSDCRSESLVKGVAGGSATGVFRGLVYVAPDAQRTDARQTSRNIELGDGARIVTKPQLEIYADDVKCSHGATVGQLDGDAILYMRQRGLSERQARRLQIEGFAADIVNRCAAEQLRELLREAVTEKLEIL